MPKEQKLVAGLLIFFGISALILGFVQINQSIAQGIKLSREQFTNAKSQITNNASQVASTQPPTSTDTKINSAPSSCQDLTPDQIAALKKKDTDHDGLSDYDELCVYHTSPYLADTDGDGYPDGQEVRTGNDPNCPAGHICKQVAQQNTLPANASSNILGSGPLANAFSAPLVSSSGASLGGATPSAQELRTMLTASGGLSPDMLNQLTDQELLDAWKATLSGGAQAGTSALPTAPPATPNPQPSTPNPPASPQTTSQGGQLNPDSMTPADLRKILKDQGVPDGLLQSVTDDELIKIFKSTVAKTNTSQ